MRTRRQGRTDPGPVIGWTDKGGGWTTTGQFQKDDFGDWSEFWTVGNKPADPAVHFSVAAPCLKEGRVRIVVVGSNMTAIRRRGASLSQRDPILIVLGIVLNDTDQLRGVVTTQGTALVSEGRRQFPIIYF